MTEQKNTIIQSVPAASQLRKVPQFNPLKHLHRATSKKTGEKVLKLDLPYKRLWFLMAHPNGRMLFNPLRITDQMAIFEARVYLDPEDTEPVSNFTSTVYAKDVPGGRYIQEAQDEALNEALDNAGFGIQLCDVVEMRRDSEYGSEIPLAQVEALMQTNGQPLHTVQQEARTDNTPSAPVERVPVVQPASPVAHSEPVMQSAPVEPSISVEPPAPVVQPAPVVDTANDVVVPVEEHQTVMKPQETVTEQTEPKSDTAAVQEIDPPVETGSILKMFGVAQDNAGAQHAEMPAVNPASEPQTAEVLDTTESAPANSFTDDMTVAEICQRMTLDEARKVAVTFGTCNGWTLAEVQDKRPSSLRFYVHGASDAGNVLKAAASLLLADMSQRKAG